MAKFKLQFYKELIKSLTIKEVLVMFNFTVFLLFTMIGYVHLVLNIDFHLQGFFKWLLITFVYGVLSSLSIYFVFKRETTVDKINDAKEIVGCNMKCGVENGKGK